MPYRSEAAVSPAPPAHRSRQPHGCPPGSLGPDPQQHRGPRGAGTTIRAAAAHLTGSSRAPKQPLPGLPGRRVRVGEERARQQLPGLIAATRSRPVRLVELPVAERPAVLKAYLSKRAYSKSPEFEAREFFGVSPNASLDDLAEIADRYPVFRIEQ